MRIHNPAITGSLTLSGSNLTISSVGTISGSATSTGSFGKVIGATVDLSGDVTFDDLTATGNIVTTGASKVISGSITSTGSFGRAEATTLSGTTLYGTVGTAAQNSITSATSLASVGTVATGVWDSTFGSTSNTTISGSLGSNASLIRTLTAAGVSGSFTTVSSSLASRLTSEEGEAEGSVVSSSAQIASDISGSFSKEHLGSKVANVVTSSAQIAADISGSLGSNASLIRTLTAVGVSGSLGSNASLIRTLTAAGISGSIDVATGSMVGNTNITTLGTIGTGTWEGTTVAVDQGGTGATSLSNLITLTTHTSGNYVATITQGTNLSSTALEVGEGTTHTLSVDDAFLVNDASDTTSGTITAAGLITSGNISGSSTSTGSFGSVHTAGNVGIGTASPAAKLQVAGDIVMGTSGTPVIRSYNVLSTAGIRFEYPSANDITISTHDSGDLMTFDSSTGNIGIGTATPSHTLDVIGDVQIDGTLTAREFYTDFVSASISYTSGSTKFGDSMDDEHQFTGSLQLSGSVGNESYIIGTNVGIGTTNPDMALHIQPAAVGGGSVGTGMFQLEGAHNTIHRPYMYFKNSTAGSTTTGGMRWLDGDGTESWAIESNRLIQTDDLEFNLAGSNKVIFDPSGNVGIGSTAPTSKLNVVSGSSYISLLQGAPGGAPNSTQGMLNVYLNKSNSAGGAWAAQIRADDQQGNGLFLRAGLNLSYYTAYMTAYDENIVHFVVRGDGNVGIGIASPTEALHISGSGTTKLFVEGDISGSLASTGSFGRTETTTLSSQTGDALSLKAPTSQDMFFYANGQHHMTLRSAGNLGVGRNGSLTGDYYAYTPTLKVEGSAPGINIYDDATHFMVLRAALDNKSEIMYDDADTFSIGTAAEADGTSYSAKLLIDSSGNIGIGTTSPGSILEIHQDVPNIRIDSYNTTAGNASDIQLRRSNHGTLATHTAVDAEDILGKITFMGSDSNSFEVGAVIRGTAAETWVNGAEYGTYLSFHTVDIGTTTLDERMRITDAGCNF